MQKFFASLSQAIIACQLIMPIHKPVPILLSRYLGKLKRTLRQPTSRIPRINAIFILILPTLLNTPQRTTIRRAPRPAITPNTTTTTIKPLIRFRQSSRTKTAADATVERVSRSRYPAPGIALRALAASHADAADGRVVLAAEAGEAAAGVDGADVSADAFEGGERAALGFDLAEGVLADTEVEVPGGAVEPAAFLQEQVGGHALGFAFQVVLLGEGFVEGGDGFVDFFAFHGCAGFEALDGGFFACAGLGGLEEFAEEDMSVCEGFFDDEGVA